MESIVKTKMLAVCVTAWALSGAAYAQCYGPGHVKHRAVRVTRAHKPEAHEVKQSDARPPFQSIDAQYRGG
jgi:hypothetical protein